MPRDGEALLTPCSRAELMMNPSAPTRAASGAACTARVPAAGRQLPLSACSGEPRKGHWGNCPAAALGFAKHRY